MENELPRRYYDFNYLLDTNINFTLIERKDILSQCSADQIKDMIVGSIIGATMISGDILYTKHKATTVFMDEKKLDGSIKNLRSFTSVNDMASFINTILKQDAEHLGKLYAQLLEFEILVANRRLTRKK